MNYKDWILVRFDSIISDLEDLAFTSIIDDMQDLIVLASSANRNFQIKFINYPGYRNLMEEFRLELWKQETVDFKKLGNFWIIKNSDWLNNLKDSEPLLEHHAGKLTHYLIATSDVVFEVLSDLPPEIIETD